MSTHNTRNEQHLNPKAYLSGFTVENEPQMIWRYTKGCGYQPGRNRASNPRLMPVREAGRIYHYYSFTRFDGTKDIDSVEKRLSWYENHGNRILFALTRLDKKKPLQLQGALRPRQKATFAGYLDLTMRRTPLPKERVTNLWRKPIDEGKFAFWRSVVISLRRYVTDQSLPSTYPFPQLLYDYERVMKSRLPDVDARLAISMLSDLRMFLNHAPPGSIKDFLTVSERFEHHELPDEFRERGIITNFRLCRILRRMRWVFLIAPSGSSFITCDNPITTRPYIGLKHGKAELTFPLSSQLALYMSWHRNLEEGFKIASPSIVGEINRRTIANATSWLYGNYESYTLSELLSSPIRIDNELYPELSS